MMTTKHQVKRFRKEEFEKRNFWQNQSTEDTNGAKNSAISPPLENFAQGKVNYAKFSKEMPKEWKKKAITALMAVFLLASFAAAVTSVVTNLASAQVEENAECPLDIEVRFARIPFRS